MTKNAGLETNLFEEELTDADLMAVVGGTGNGGIVVSEADPTGSTTVTTDRGLKTITVFNTQNVPDLGTQTVTITR